MKKSTFILLIGILLIAFIGIRVALLFTSQQALDGDRAVEGIMAKHILEKGARPFFLYGAHYAGNIAFLAHVSAFFFTFLGVSSLSFKISALFLATVFFFISVFFMRHFFGQTPALIVGLLLVFSPEPFLLWGTNLPAFTFVFSYNVILLWLFFILFFKTPYSKNLTDKRKNIFFLILGLFTAISYWLAEYVIIIVLVFFFFWYLKDKLFFLTKNFLLFLGAALIGGIPMIVYNLRNNFANIKQFMAGNVIHKIACDYGLIPNPVQFGDKLVDSCKIFGQTRDHVSIGGLLVQIFPDLFSSSHFGIVYYLIFLFSLLFMIYLLRKEIFPIIKAVLPVQKHNLSLERIHKEWFFIAFICLNIILFLLSGFNGIAHLITLYPFFIFILALLISRFIQTKKLLIKLSGGVMLVILCAIPLIDGISLIYQPDPEEIQPILTLMKEEGIDYVYAPYFVKWRIIFESGEDIIASCKGLCPCSFRYPLYEEIVEQNANLDSYGYAFEKYSLLNEKFALYLEEHDIFYQYYSFNEVDVYYRFDQFIIPGDVIESCIDKDGKSDSSVYG